MPDYWFLTPYCLAGATIAMSSGVGGPIFFTPLFILVLQLPPATAVAAALLTQTFGFLSGSIAYWRRGLIDTALARRLVGAAVPAALVGGLLAGRLPGDLLRAGFGVVAAVVGWRVIVSASRADVASMDTYPRARLAEGIATTTGGATLLGLISVGLAELQSYHFLVRARLAPARAVATNVAVVVAGAAAASIGHLLTLTTQAADDALGQIGQLLIFTVPGVLLGGQLGPRLQAHLTPVAVQRGIGSLLIGVGLVMLIMRTETPR